MDDDLLACLSRFAGKYGVPVPEGLKPSDEGQYATCIAPDGLFVRAAPVDGKTVGGLIWGQRVKVLNRIYGGGWLEIVTLDGKLTGWASETWLRME